MNVTREEQTTRLIPLVGTGAASSGSDRRSMAERVIIDGIEVVLTAADQHESEWLDFDFCTERLQAAWLRLSDTEPPLNPRIVGEPGLGKTTLVCAVARQLGLPVYLFQCTMDTRPEDLVITPVLNPDRYPAEA